MRRKPLVVERNWSKVILILRLASRYGIFNYVSKILSSWGAHSDRLECSLTGLERNMNCQPPDQTKL